MKYKTSYKMMAKNRSFEGDNHRLPQVTQSDYRLNNYIYHDDRWRHPDACWLPGWDSPLQGAVPQPPEQLRPRRAPRAAPGGRAAAPTHRPAGPARSPAHRRNCRGTNGSVRFRGRAPRCLLGVGVRGETERRRPTLKTLSGHCRDTLSASPAQCSGSRGGERLRELTVERWPVENKTPRLDKCPANLQPKDLMKAFAGISLTESNNEARKMEQQKKIAAKAGELRYF
ncbi:uncharacterized protein [Agelaius tricolor]|uniref:uncharacterized protein n=1 Tax=Agelaius tricolor TaxID=9191 RepID=UPI0039F23C92